MRADHAAFIEEYASSFGGAVTGTCAGATLLMLDAFPELRRVRGHVTMQGAPDGDTRAWAHWWLLDPDGHVVDPTRSQFPCGDLIYTAWMEGADEPTGKCLNCGVYVYKVAKFCSVECCNEFVASLQ